jgi:NUDIX domain-containing protein
MVAKDTWRSPRRPPLVVIEGVGASRRQLAHLIDAAVWVQSDWVEAERHGLVRDGGDAEATENWHAWMSEELPFLAADRPELLEELGIVVDEPDIESIAGDMTAGSDLRLSVYRVHRWQGQPFNACPKEHDQIDWFEIGDLSKLDLAHPAYVDLLGAPLT